MKIVITALLFLYLFTFESVRGSQQIETVVFPSEDEITEAFALGEISFEQFLTLTELIANGVDPTSFLLEEIPHTFLRIDTIIISNDIYNQDEYFINNYSNKFLTIKNQYASYLEEDASSRYQTSISYKKEQLQFNLILKKEYSGRERYTRRYISFTPDNKNYTVLIGNYTKKFGLGGILGYRGKLLSYDDQISAESFLFPDYGGMNGLYATINYKKLSFQLAESYHRDDDFSVFTNVLMVSSNQKEYPSLIVGVHSIKKIESQKSFYDFKASLIKKFNYAKGYFATEIVADFNKQNYSSAILIDGKHKTNKVKLSYALWKYGEAFVNISGGSKTSLISEDVILYEIQDTLLSKRSNQTGGRIESQVQLNDNWRVDVSTIYSYKNIDTTELQLYTRISRKLNSVSNLSFDVLFRDKERIETVDDFPEEKTQLRINYTYNQKNIYLRNYFSNLDRTNENSYLGYFSEIKLHTDHYGLLHLWLNFSRINRETEQLDYFYGFIKNDIRINHFWSIGFKLSHKYNRYASVSHTNQFSIDASWQI